MTRYLQCRIAIVLCIAASVAACSHAGPVRENQPIESGHDALPDDFGTYRFADGRCVTGGRFDESGTQRLLLTDVWRNRLGGLFEGNGAAFDSVMDPAVSISFEDGRERLTWNTASMRQVAVRVHAPRRIEANFESDGARLAGTLYLPSRQAGHALPGIVLAHGSGPQNRYAGPWTSFFVDLGFAVLSYDKRGVDASGGDLETADYARLETDLAAAVRWLAARPEVDGQRVGIHASSQSGWYAPSVAADAPLAFLLVRAGPTLPTGPTTLHERVHEWRADGLDEAAVKQASRLWTALMALAARDGTRDAAQSLLDAARAEAWFAPAYGDWSTVRAEWWRQQRVNAAYRPVEDLARHALPTLWFLAERDENVPYPESAAALQAHARAAGSSASAPSVALVIVREAGHDFLVRADGGPVRYTDDYWPRMAEWLRQYGFTGPATPALDCAGAQTG